MNPNLKNSRGPPDRTKWSRAELETLFQVQAELGSTWSQITERLGGRCGAVVSAVTARLPVPCVAPTTELTVTHTAAAAGLRA